MKTCEQCGEEFEPTEQNEDFCSWACADEHAYHDDEED